MGSEILADMKSLVALGVAVLAAVGIFWATSASSSAPRTAGGGSAIIYTHPVGDVSNLDAGCDAFGNPNVTLWLTNHAQHAMAYKVTLTFFDEHNLNVGSADRVFTLTAAQVMGNQKLFDQRGKCAANPVLSVVAYDFTGQHGQPYFP
jgi:hypothetical protein